LPRVIAAIQGFLPEGSMRRHDWIFDMLTDLRDYANANGLPDLASSVGMTLAVARRETAPIDPEFAPRPVRDARPQ
jgi:hypothetical protein